MASAFPLEWPEGYKKTKSSDRQRARFKTSFAHARNDLLHELQLMGVGDWEVVLSTNVELRRDGLPYSGRKPNGSPGVAVYFRRNDEQQVIPCDCWDRVEDNLRAVGKTIEAMRGIERWGSGELMNRAFSGFKALPASGDDWRSVFGYSTDRVPDIHEVKALYRNKARENHPDQGGNEHEMIRLNQAMAAAEKELNAI